MAGLTEPIWAFSIRELVHDCLMFGQLARPPQGIQVSHTNPTVIICKRHCKKLSSQYLINSHNISESNLNSHFQDPNSAVKIWCWKTCLAGWFPLQMVLILCFKFPSNLFNQAFAEPKPQFVKQSVTITPATNSIQNLNVAVCGFLFLTPCFTYLQHLVNPVSAYSDVLWGFQHVLGHTGCPALVRSKPPHRGPFRAVPQVILVKCFFKRLHLSLADFSGDTEMHCGTITDARIFPLRICSFPAFPNP